MYEGQVKKLDSSPEDKMEVIRSERKLHDLGFIKELSDEQKSKIDNSQVQYFIPWRAVWNGNSVSTPCRLVFDASQKLKTLV